jgi:PAS domain S-box-containing protein
MILHTKTAAYVSLIIFLCLLGLIGNYFSINLFFGVDFIFGSIAVLLAIRFLDIRAALLVAIITGSYTYFLWGHPYAMIIFIVEAIIVSTLLGYKVKNLVVADTLFWLVIGMPLIWLFYHFALNMSPVQSQLILLKQPINGIVNAILASYILYLVPSTIRQWIPGVTTKIHLHELVFTFLLTFAVFSTLIIIINENHTFLKHQESSLKYQLELQSRDLDLEIRREYRNKGSVDDFKSIAQSVSAKKPGQEIIIATKDQQVLSSTLIDSKAQDVILKRSFKQTTTPGLFLYAPDLGDMPDMKKWNHSFYYITNQLNLNVPLNTYLLQSGSVVTEAIQKNILTALFVLFIVILIASVTAYSISTLLARSILRLARLTKALPDKLQHLEKVNWPSSRIEEIEQLIQVTKKMANVVSADFDDMNNISTAIIEASTNAIVTWDDAGIILGFNKSAEILFQYSRDDVVGRSVKVLLPDVSHELFDAFLINPNSDQFTRSQFHLNGLRQNTSCFPIEASITQVNLSNKVIFTGIIADISERKANEQLKRDFISTVSHELRTPLTSIKGSLKLLKAGTDKFSANKLNKLLEISDRNAERLSVLIDDLLDFEELDSGKFEYDLTNVDVSKLIDEVVEELEPLALQNSVELIRNAHSDIWLLIDKLRLSQIIRNLLSNAIKFSFVGGSVEINCISSTSEVTITVKDYGRGISSDFAGKVFNKFEQAESADNKQIQRGTGLGLAISKRMTDDLGGTIGFDSLEGSGSTFYVIFPKHAVSK